MYELAAATVEYGRQVGARVLEGYPTEPTPGKAVIWDEASVGLLQVFIDAGYEVEASPTCAAGWSDTDSAQRPDARFCPNRHLLEAAGEARFFYCSGLRRMTASDRSGPGHRSRISGSPPAFTRWRRTSATITASSSCPATGMKSGTRSKGRDR